MPNNRITRAQLHEAGSPYGLGMSTARAVLSSIRSVTGSSVPPKDKEAALLGLFRSSLAPLGNEGIASLLYGVAGMEAPDLSGWDKYTPAQMEPFLSSMAAALAAYRPSDFPDGCFDAEPATASAAAGHGEGDGSSYASSDGDWDTLYSKEAVEEERIRRRAEMEGKPVDLFRRELEARGQRGLAKASQAPALKSAARRIGRLFSPGKDCAAEAAAAEAELVSIKTTVVARLRSAEGTSFWSSTEMEPGLALRDLVTVMDTDPASPELTGLWFTDLTAGNDGFQYAFITMDILPESMVGPDSEGWGASMEGVVSDIGGHPVKFKSVKSRFSTSGTLLRLATHVPLVMRIVPGFRRLVNLLFGARFEFDPTQPDNDARLLYPAAVNWNFLDSLYNAPCLARIVVDPGNPGYRSDSRHNLIRKRPMRISANRTDGRPGKSDFSVSDESAGYMGEIADMMERYEGVSDVLWYCPMTQSTDNTNVRLGGGTRLAGAGSQPGRFEVPDGIRAINPLCFGLRNEYIRELALPDSLEFLPPMLHSALPNLEHITNPPAPDGKVPDGLWMGARRVRDVSVPAGVTEVGYGAFADSTVEEAVFDEPDSIESIGDCAFTGFAENPLLGVNTAMSNGRARPSRYLGLAGGRRTDVLSALFASINMPCPDRNQRPLPIPKSVKAKGEWAPRFSLHADKWDITGSCPDEMRAADRLFTNVLSSGSLKIVGDGAFWGRTGLETAGGDLILPDSVEYIGPCAFGDSLYNTGKLVIPEHILPDFVGDMVFCLSYRLMDIAYNGHCYDVSSPGLGTGFFDFAGIDNLVRIRAYEYATGLDKYGDTVSYKDFVADRLKAPSVYGSCSRLREIVLPKAFARAPHEFFRVFGFWPDTVSDLFNITLTYI